MRAGAGLILHERGPSSVRARVGALLREAATADFAVSRIRLAALDLTAAEIAGVTRCRVLLGQLDAGTLLDTAEGVPAAAADQLGVLLSFIASGRLEVRAAGLSAWTPDFSVFRGDSETALLGAHFFARPYIIGGLSLTAAIDDPDAIGLLAARFEEIWRAGHDVLPAIGGVLERTHALALEAARRRGGADGAGAPAGG